MGKSRDGEFIATFIKKINSKGRNYEENLIFLIKL